MGAAMTVSSAVGIISSYYVREESSHALSIFAAAGAVDFGTGLVFGGFLTLLLRWRYVFWLSVIVTGVLSIVGWIILPADRRKGLEKPKLDFAGAALSTGGLILLSFVLSSGGLWLRLLQLLFRNSLIRSAIGVYG
jgi:predicted MFS family arabinose efflux permease